MLTPEEKQAIDNFYDAVGQLRKLDIIRSNRYLGDLGEFIASKAFGFKLNKNKRQKGYDATKKKKKYEVKYADGTKTNISLGNPKTYDYIILVIGCKSVLFDPSLKGSYAVYELPSSITIKYPNPKGGYSFGKNVLHNLKPKAVF
ncbi:MAG TPA: hypothetical protein VNR38_06100 [Ureibacillus sp.]|nr:hypothetical protein [Ureibacillus sp.]